MAAIIGISKKELEKLNKELLELHKRVITNYLHQRGLKLKTRNRFFKLYDYYIDENNIHCYFFYPVHWFIKYLVLDKLYKIDQFYIANHHRSIKSSKQKRRKK